MAENNRRRKRKREGRKGIEYRRVVLDDEWEKMQEWEQKWFIREMIKRGDIILVEAKADALLEEGLHLKESEYERSLKQ